MQEKNSKRNYTGSFTRMEQWDRQVQNQSLKGSYEVRVTVGKPLDVTALKKSSVEETRSYAAFLESTAKSIYSNRKSLISRTACPCCHADNRVSNGGSVAIYGALYIRCVACDHLFIKDQPDVRDLNKIFLESESHSSAYTDKAVVEVRLEQVVQPKLNWILDFCRQSGRKMPQMVLDVGAGGGHFVACCRKKSIHAEGIELSRASRRFALEVFDLELRDQDFLTLKRFKPTPDLLTFFGLLEYTPDPFIFLKVARELLDPSGLLVVEVPRADCVSTAIQEIFPNTVARHLDPTSHMNCFSDRSLIALMDRAGFQPLAAWYFGMDAYELLMQFSLNSNVNFSQLALKIPKLQSYLDQGRLCDDIILICAPIK